MTIQEIKQKHNIPTICFRRILDANKKETEYLIAKNESGDLRFIIHDLGLQRLLKNRMEDLNVSSLRISDDGGKFLYDRYFLSVSGLSISINLSAKEQSVGVIPKIKNVQFDRIKSYADEYKILEKEYGGFINPHVSESIAIDLVVTFKIDNNIWEIPYLILLQKMFIKDNSEYKYLYRKSRTRLLRFDEIPISNPNLYPFMVHTLLLLDRTHSGHVSAENFERGLNQSVFYFGNDVKYDTNKECKYRIVQTFFAYPQKNITNLTLMGDEQVTFKDLHYKSSNSPVSYFFNIVPDGFQDSYREKVRKDSGRIIDIYENYSDPEMVIDGPSKYFNSERANTHGETIYRGTYEECVQYLSENDVTKLKKMIRITNTEASNRNRQTINDNYYQSDAAESDYFDAMTDGQLGTYDEFIEGGGDINNFDKYL